MSDHTPASANSPSTPARGNGQRKRDPRSARSQRESLEQAMADVGLLNESSREQLPQEQRWRHRQLHLQLLRHRNLESIFALIKEESTTEHVVTEMDRDWLHQFAQLAEQIHAAPMQRLWARIFIMESTHSGSFSVKALQTLQLLTQREANLFQRACRLSSLIGFSSNPKVITGCKSDRSFAGLFSSQQHWPLQLSKYGLPYAAIMTLVDNGLLFASELESGEFSPQTPTAINYNNTRLSITAERQGVKLTYYRFTPIAVELSQLLSAHVEPDYLQALESCLSNSFRIEN